MQKFKHIMVDIETLDNLPTSAIVSIGAVQFDLETGETGEEFYETISRTSCEELGLTVGIDTLKWWEKQKDAAKQEAFNGTTPIVDALKRFIKFVKKVKSPTVWANSPSFDLIILHNAFRQANLKSPWKFFNENCVRTYGGIFPQLKNNITAAGVSHNALEDCHVQVEYTSAIYQRIVGGTYTEDIDSPVDGDGKDHINVYSKGKTQTGRWLSNFALCSINLPDDGKFKSIEGYWYWLSTHDDRLRTLSGWNAKNIGKSIVEEMTAAGTIIKLTEEEFQSKIKTAIDYKLKSDVGRFILFCRAPQPLKHYYVYGTPENPIVKDAGYQWILDHLEARRIQMREHIAKTNTKPIVIT